MRIPRQSDTSSARTAERAAGAAVLRAHRRHLTGQLRSVGYWQRLVQARTDLSVAGLLYGAPVPTGGSTPAHAGGPPRTGEDDHDLSGLLVPPEGVDVGRLLQAVGPEGTGAHLERLRGVALVLAGRRRALQTDLDVVTAALHEQLASDGADPDPAPAPGGTAALSGDRAALT